MQNESLTLRVSPAGKLFLRYLVTFNSGNREKMKAFISEHFHEDMVDRYSAESLVDWYQDMFLKTEGLNIHKVFLTQEYYIIVITKSKADSKLYMDKMKVSAERPFRIIEHLHETTT